MPIPLIHKTRVIQPRMGKMRAARGVELLVLPLSLHNLPLYWLVVWNMFYDFPYIGNFIFPTVTHSIIFQRARLLKTTNQSWIFWGFWEPKTLRLQLHGEASQDSPFAPILSTAMTQISWMRKWPSESSFGSCRVPGVTWRSWNFWTLVESSRRWCPPSCKP